MAGKPMCERSELSQMLAEILRPRQELFAVNVASGMSYRRSARLAGYHEDHGDRLMRKAGIRERVEELKDAPGGERLLARIQANLFQLANRPGKGDLKDIQWQPKLADVQAKIWRLTENRRQAADAKPDWRKMGRAELDAMLAKSLESLAPGESARLRRIADGEVGAPGGGSET
jgi:hypothetical protein